MNGTPVLSIATWVSAGEEAILVAAAEQLGDALRDDAGRPWPVRLSRASEIRTHHAAAPELVVGSLLPHLFPLDRALGTIADVWRERAAAVPPAERCRLYLCTIFRAVPASRAESALLERIRRLDLLAAELSREFGLTVIDLDRALSFYGAELLQADYRLGSRRAIQAAGHVIASALLGGDLGGLVAAERQALGVRRHGGLLQLGDAVDRRLAAAAQRPSDQTEQT